MLVKNGGSSVGDYVATKFSRSFRTQSSLTGQGRAASLQNGLGPTHLLCIRGAVFAPYEEGCQDKQTPPITTG